jgi:hypothetical protein
MATESVPTLKQISSNRLLENEAYQKQASD